MNSQDPSRHLVDFASAVPRVALAAAAVKSLGLKVVFHLGADHDCWGRYKLLELMHPRRQKSVANQQGLGPKDLQQMCNTVL